MSTFKRHHTRAFDKTHPTLPAETKRVLLERLNKQSLAQRVVDAYEQFLQLKIAAGDWDATLYSPSPAVDNVWHEHILDTRRYAADCLAMCGHMIQHNPDGAQDADYETRKRQTANDLRRVFNVDPTQYPWFRPVDAIVFNLRMYDTFTSTWLPRTATVGDMEEHAMWLSGWKHLLFRLHYEGRPLFDESASLMSLGMHHDVWARVEMYQRLLGC